MKSTIKQVQFISFNVNVTFSVNYSLSSFIHLHVTPNMEKTYISSVKTFLIINICLSLY